MEEEKNTPQDNPPWMDLAWNEYLLWQENGWTIHDPEGRKRAQSYVRITGNYYSPAQAGWCRCFVDWVLKKTILLYGTDFSTVANNPTGSQNYATRKRYPGSFRLPARLDRAPYGSIVVLNTSPWQGHVGFLVNVVRDGKKRYAYLLSGNQEDKVCVQEFEVYRQGRKILYQTRRGKVFTLKGFVFPKQYDFPAQGPLAEYCAEGYEAVEKFVDREGDINLARDK